MANHLVDPITLEKIVLAAKRQLDLEQKLDDLDEEMSRVNAELATVSGGWGYENNKGFAIEGIIPKLLEEADVEKIVMTGGLIVEVNREIKCPSMAQDSDKKEIVLAWADKTGNSGVIKDYVAIPFEKGDIRITAVLALMSTLRLDYERFRSIHPGTLKSLFKEILKTPKKIREEFSSDAEYQDWMMKNELPMDELGIQEYKKSKIIKPKEPKVKIK